MGRRLTRKLFERLKPGGELLIANFLNDLLDVGYMEIFMNWNLILRSREEIVDMTKELPEGEFAMQTFADDARAIGYALIKRL